MQTQETLSSTFSGWKSLGVTLLGSLGSVAGWANSNAAGMWMGVLIAAIGLYVNWKFKVKENKRKQEAHEAWMKKMEFTGPTPFPEGGIYGEE